VASLSFQNSQTRRGYRIQFRDVTKRKRSIWLGDVAEHLAIEFKSHVEHLLICNKDDQPPEPATTRWLGRISDVHRDKLANCGLVESVSKRSARVLPLGQFLIEYIDERTDVSEATRGMYHQVRNNLIEYFGSSKKLRDITVADAKRWRIWLATQSNKRDKKRSTLAEATVGKRVQRAKQFFREAVEREYCDANPFEKLRSGSPANPDRQFFVTQEMINQCIQNAPCGDWRTIVALARYGGLRCPSEVLKLRWSDVDLPGGKMMIDSPKTGLRVCPIFEELRPHLEAAWDEAPDGAEFVINRYRSANQNLRTTFERIIKLGGLKPWPRLFHNLRASRETELMARWPAADVAAWIGHSVPIAMKHYAMATDISFREAAGLSDDGGGGSTGGSIYGRSAVVSSRTETNRNEENTPKNGVLTAVDGSCESYQIAEEGFEPPTRGL